MIPQAYIREWSNYVPWKTNEQIEQDLVICRALVEIFSIDLVQITAEPFGPIIDKLRDKLSFVGEPQRKLKENNSTLIYRFDSEFAPIQKLRLKVETNCREHFSVLGFKEFPFEVKSSWYSGSCQITTYKLEELLGTKLRALYQRSKGRDLYDMYKALIKAPHLNINEVIDCYKEYMRFSVEHPPSKREFLINMESKVQDSEFIGDTTAILRPEEKYNYQEAYELVKTTILEKL